MYRAILVPLDGSHTSEQALPTAIRLARRHAARLHLVEVVSFPDEQDREYIRRVSGWVSDEMGESVSFAVVEDPGTDPLFPPTNADVADTLVRYCSYNDVDLLVMATHGRGALRRAWLGSVADAVIRRTRLPVLLVRAVAESAGAPGAWLHAPRWKHVLVPVDGSDAAHIVVGRAAELARGDGARVTLLRVLPPPVLLDAPYSLVPEEMLAGPEQRRVAHRRLDGHVEELRRLGLDTDAVILVNAQPATAILDYARDNGVDLIAMGTRGKRGWERLLLGSVAERVIHHATTPVLLFPPAYIAGDVRIAREAVAEFGSGVAGSAAAVRAKA